MTRKDLSLLKTMLASKSCINVLRHSKDKKKRNRAALDLFSIILFMVMGASYIYVISYSFYQMGYGKMIPSLSAVSVSSLVLILTYTKSNGYLYAFKEYDILMAMPFTVKQIVSSRFLLMYLKDLPLHFAISLAGLVAYGMTMDPSIWIYIAWIIMTPFLPLLPSLLATLLGALIANIGSRFKHKTLIQTILSFAVIIFSFFFRYFLDLFFRGEGTNAMIDQSSQALSSISNYIPTIRFFENAIVKESILSFFLMILISLITFLVSILFISRNYGKINSKLTTGDRHKKKKITSNAYKKRSMISSIAFKEFKRVTASALCASNLGLGAVMSILVTIILPFVDMKKIISSLSEGAQFDISPLALVWPILVYFFVGMLPTTAPSPSLEGKNEWILDSLPIDKLTIYKGKMYFNLCLNMIPAVLAVISGMYAFRARWYEYILGVFMIVSMCLFSTTYGMHCGIRHRRLDWDDEAEVVKQGTAVSLYLFPNMIVSMILMSGMGVLVYMGGSVIGAAIIIAVYGILAFLFYLSVKRLAR